MPRITSQELATVLKYMAFLFLDAFTQNTMSFLLGKLNNGNITYKSRCKRHICRMQLDY